MGRWFAKLVGVLMLCAMGLCAQMPVLLRPMGIAYDAQGNLFIADSARNQVLESTVGGTLVVVAGTGVQGFGGDGGAATAALLNAPQGVAVGGDGTVYIADTGNHRVRSIDAGGVIRTVAGTGVHGFSGDGGDAALAELNAPGAVAVSSSGLFIADTGNQRVRLVAIGVITTVAGVGRQGFGGDGGPATAALLDSPAGIAVTVDDRLVIADLHNQRVRVVAADGTIATIAGTGVASFSGDGGAAAQARLALPRGVAVAADGSILIADSGNARVRIINPAGVISTVAGSGVQGGAADGSAVNVAALNELCGVAVSPFGVVTFAETAGKVVKGIAVGNLFVAAGLAPGRNSAVQWTPPSSSTYGSGVLTVSVSGAVGIPQGKVQLQDAGVAVASASLVQGSVSLPLDTLSAGQRALSLVYAGDGFNPKAVSSATVNVLPFPITAVANAATVEYGAPLPALSGTLTGVLARDVGKVSVTFSAGASGLAAVGSYPITAALSGPASGNYVLANGNTGVSLTVTQAHSATVLQAPAAGYAGSPMTLTASVSPAYAGLPGGQVAFFDGAMQVASAPVVNGVATGVYLAPANGTHSLTAQYAGDADFLPSSSTAQVATVGAMPDFSIAVQGASAQAAIVGTTATYTLAVTGVPGPFSGVVALSAAGLPSSTQVTFAPTAVVPGAGTVKTVMSVPTALLLSQNRNGSWEILLAMTPLLWMARRRGRWVPVLLGMFLISATGCGTRTVPDSVTNSKTYTITVTATGVNLAGAVVAHSTTVQLTVE